MAEAKTEKSAQVAKKDKKPGFFSKAIRFLKEVNGERKKIIWPSKSKVINNTIVVIVFMVFVALFIGLIDLGLGALVDLMYSFAG